VGEFSERGFLERHANGRVHADFLKGRDLARGGDAASGDNGQARGAAQFAEPG